VVALGATALAVIPSNVASAASRYQPVSTTGSGPSAVSGFSMSADGRIVAWAQGGGCAYWRDRQQQAGAAIDQQGRCGGPAPAVSTDGCRMAYAAVQSGVPDVYVVDRCSTANPNQIAVTPPTWRAAGGATVSTVAISSSGQFVAFGATVAGTAHVFVFNVDDPAAMSDVPGGGAVPALGADPQPRLVYASGNRLLQTTAVQPTTTDLLGTASSTIESIAIAGNTGGVAVSLANGAELLTNGQLQPLADASARTPSISGDGSLIAYSRASQACAGCREVVAAPIGEQARPLVTAIPLSNGFFAPRVSNDHRELVFIANPARAADPAGPAVAQVYAWGPQLSTTDVDFGAVAVGTTATAKIVTITNSGTTTATISSIQIADATFAVAGGTCAKGLVLAVNDQCTVQVTFTPAQSGVAQAVLAVAEQGPWDAATAQANLTGTGETAAITASPSNLDFGSVAVGSQGGAESVTVTNSGTLATTIGTVVLNGGSAASFPLAGNSCAGATLAPGATCSVSLTFVPSGPGTETATLDISGTSGATVSVGLSGTGLFNPSLSITPTSADYGRVVVGTATTPHVFTITNDGNVTNQLGAVSLSGATSAFSVTGDGCTGSSLGVGASCTVTVAFSSANAGAVTASVSVTGTGGSSAAAQLSGEAILAPTLTLAPGIAVTGQVLSAVGAHFAPGSQVTLVWDAGAGSFVATADANGAFAQSVWFMPYSAPSGVRHLEVVGANPPLEASVFLQQINGGNSVTSPPFQAGTATR
jgi:hypothetical protein